MPFKITLDYLQKLKNDFDEGGLPAISMRGPLPFPIGGFCDSSFPVPGTALSHHKFRTLLDEAIKYMEENPTVTIEIPDSEIPPIKWVRCVIKP